MFIIVFSAQRAARAATAACQQGGRCRGRGGSHVTTEQGGSGPHRPQDHGRGVPPAR